MTPTRFRRTRAAATLTSAVVVALAACSSPTPSPTRSPSPTTTTTPQPTPTATPSASVDPAESEAEQAALAAYAAYWAGVVRSFADPTQSQDPALQQNAGHTALTDAQSVLIKYRTDGIHMVGEPEFSPVVQDVDLGAGPTVKVSDCIEVANWQPIFTATGEGAGAPGQSTRVSYETSVVRVDDRWLVWTVTVDRAATC